MKKKKQVEILVGNVVDMYSELRKEKSKQRMCMAKLKEKALNSDSEEEYATIIECLTLVRSCFE